MISAAVTSSSIRQPEGWITWCGVDARHHLPGLHSSGLHSGRLHSGRLHSGGLHSGRLHSGGLHSGGLELLALLLLVLVILDEHRVLARLPPHLLINNIWVR